MASQSIPPLSSYSTALVLLPPAHIQSRINLLRSANDKSFPRWTSHLTMVFPFVEPSQLPKASSLIQDAISKANLSPFTFQLDRVDSFKQREYNTVYLGPSNATNVHRVWDVISSVVGYKGRSFVPHLTLGQAHHRENTLTFLQGKGRLLLDSPIQWEVGSIVILRKSEAKGGLMKIHDEIPLSLGFPPSPRATVAGLHPASYRFTSDRWIPSEPVTSFHPKALTLTTYNVLSDSNHSTMHRFPRLLSTLLTVQPIPDVVCLQEVTDDFLRHLLADPLVRARWPRCTHDPASVLPGEHNVIFLARDPTGLAWEYVHLHGKHKPAVVLRLTRGSAQPLVVAGIHLTAGLRPSQRHKKLEELETLLTFLRQLHPSSPWILMGDFNIPTSQSVPTSITDTFHDAWLTVRESECATYNPGSNALAAETAKEDRSPQRYDRIWIRRDMGLRVQVVDMFGHRAEAASDHYGLTTTIEFSEIVDVEVEVSPMRAEFTLTQAAGAVGKPTAALDDDLEAFVRQEGGFPAEAQRAERARVIPTLRTIFILPIHPPSVEADPQDPVAAPAIVQSIVRFEFVPVGSFGLGIDTHSSDLDVLVVGNISARTFWAIARARIRKSAAKLYIHDEDDAPGKEPAPGVILKRFVKDASVQMMELLVGGVRVDMQYCSASKLLESWDKVHVLNPTNSLFLLPAPSLRTLNAYRDMLHILRVLPAPSLPAFRLSLRALKLFCASQGIHSSRLGYLGGIHITLLLSRVALLSPPDSSASQLVSAFFAMYAEWDWAQQVVTIPQVNDKTSYTRTPGREPMAILSIEKPVINVVLNANKHTTSAIASTFQRAHWRLIEGATWTEVCGSGGVCGTGFEESFLRSHESYIKIDLSFWGSSPVKARSWIGYVESRLPHLLVLLQASLPNWGVRLWPVRLVDANNSGDLSTGLQTFYLLGLDALKELTSGKKIQTLLLAFEDQLRRNERFYDATEMFVSVSPVGPSQLPERITTPPAWPDRSIDPDDDTSDEEDAELSDKDEERDLDAAFAPISAKQIKKSRPQQSRGNSTPHLPAPKLRTSSDVYNRIVWDRELDTEDYLIGYTDRFAGLQEMALTNWKRDVEHEEFVPFHRVMHFRRKSDGVLIWDRRNKVDLMFGSGVQPSST